MSSKRYVRLLPSDFTTPIAASPGAGSVAPPPLAKAVINQTRKRKRVGTQLACNLCRLKKIRCDGTRPSCKICAKRSEKCVYNEKRDATQDAVDIVELLSLAPYSEALEALRLLRTTGDGSAVLSVIRGSDNDSRDPTSEQPSPRASVPQRSSLELELMTKNPITYAPLRHISMSELEESNLLRPISAAREKKRPEDTPLWHGEMMFVSRERSAEAAQIDNDSAAASFRAQESTTSRSPRWNEGLCDSRLKSLNIAHWTNVPIPNEAAARVISMYLETDHPLLGMFDPDKFISDLVDHRDQSCSALVVNALLYWGCQMYTAIDKSVAQHTEPFCVETERLWAAAECHDSLLNMVGAQLLSLAFVGQGKDHKVLHFLGAAICMGTRLGLFGVDEDVARTRMEAIPESSRAAISNTAWGLFNWSIIVSMFYQQPGVAVPKHPPIVPIPGVDMAENSQKSSANATPSDKPSQVQEIMGVTFPRVCELWALMHEVSLLYHHPEDLVQPASLSLDYAEMKYRELLAWAENLPFQLHRSDANPHHAVILHMWFHAAILDIFRPFLKRSEAIELRLRTFSAPDRTPMAAYMASVNQLKHLIVHFRSNYEASTCTLLWHTAMTYVANAMLRDSQDPEWYQYMLLCLYGYEMLRRPFRVAEAIGRGLLTMMLRDNKDVTSAQAHEILRHLQERGLSYVTDDEIRAPFMGDLELAQTDPAGAAMEKLAGDFEDMALFREFTTGND